MKYAITEVSGVHQRINESIDVILLGQARLQLCGCDTTH